jgi:hypothetical protein
MAMVKTQFSIGGKMKNIVKIAIRINLILAPVSISIAGTPEKDFTERCPVAKTKTELVENFVQADALGARLTSQSNKVLKECFELGDAPAWDYFYVIDNFQIEECKTPSAHCAAVRFEVVGLLYANSPFEPFQGKNRVKSYEIQIEPESLKQMKTQSKEFDSWKLSGINKIAPHIRRADAISYLEILEESLIRENSKADISWISKARKSLSTFAAR